MPHSDTVAPFTVPRFPLSLLTHTHCAKQWWKVTNYIYPRTVLKNKLEALILSLSISILRYFILLLRYSLFQCPTLKYCLSKTVLLTKAELWLVMEYFFFSVSLPLLLTISILLPPLVPRIYNEPSLGPRTMAWETLLLKTLKLTEIRQPTDELWVVSAVGNNLWPLW